MKWQTLGSLVYALGLSAIAFALLPFHLRRYLLLLCCFALVLTCVCCCVFSTYSERPDDRRGGASSLNSTPGKAKCVHLQFPGRSATHDAALCVSCVARVGPLRSATAWTLILPKAAW